LKDYGKTLIFARKFTEEWRSHFFYCVPGILLDKTLKNGWADGWEPEQDAQDDKHAALE